MGVCRKEPATASTLLPREQDRPRYQLESSQSLTHTHTQYTLHARSCKRALPVAGGEVCSVLSRCL